MPTGVCKRVIIVYHELCGKSQGLHNCVLRYVRKSPQKTNPVRLGCLFGITKESDFRLASLAISARVYSAMKAPKNISPTHPQLIPNRPHKCLKPARLPPDGLHLFPSYKTGESTAIGLTFIRQNTHASARVCCPTDSPRTLVRINTYHRDIAIMRLSGMRRGAIFGLLPSARCCIYY